MNLPLPTVSPGAPPPRAGHSPSADALGIYVHFPWCLSKCPYCDFVAFAAPRSSIDGAAYTDAVLAELSARGRGLGGRRVTSLFFGGGTPSLWGAHEVGRVIEAVARSFAPAAIEVSLECDPSSLDEDVARALVDAGINRLSIGVQALDDERLRFLGRIHTEQEAIDAVHAAVRAGVPRVSTDLMYAVAGQTPVSAARDATALADLGATHVSAYSLTIESATPFGQLARRGRLPLCDDAVMAESFFAIDEALADAGFAHYEVSNYAKPDNEAQHNLGYWQGRDYLGLGCGAYGTLRGASGALRYRNQATPRAYLAAASERGAIGDDLVRCVTASEEPLDGPALLRERIMLGLRMKQGFDLEAAAVEVGADPYPADRRAALAGLEARGRIVRHAGRITVPREAWIWVDDTAATLF
ncbi:MAG TPA: radical SAM family heme chaperone HemW [Polyangiaceae bacterium]|nr:radical SAM family heme chaperone HemW [Polyangiaceae bacterium]